MARIVEALQPTDGCPTVVLDLMGFDAAPAVHCINQLAQGALSKYLPRVAGLCPS